MDLCTNENFGGVRALGQMRPVRGEEAREREDRKDDLSF
jgi:hypothetical protein